MKKYLTPILIFILVLSLVFFETGHIARADTITLDGTVQTFQGGAGFSQTITVGANSNRLLIVSYGTHQGNGDATAMSYNGVALTEIKAQLGSFGEMVSIWGLVAPATGANTLSVSAPGNDFNAFGVYSLFGVNQSLPTVTQGASGNSLTASLSITPISNNDWVIDVAEAEATLTKNAAQTLDWSQTSASFENAGGSHVVQTTATPQTMSWNLSSGQRWNQAAIAVEPASSAAAVSTTPVVRIAGSIRISGGTMIIR